MSKLPFEASIVNNIQISQNFSRGDDHLSLSNGGAPKNYYKSKFEGGGIFLIYDRHNRLLGELFVSGRIMSGFLEDFEKLVKQWDMENRQSVNPVDFPEDSGY